LVGNKDFYSLAYSNWNATICGISSNTWNIDPDVDLLNISNSYSNDSFQLR